MRGEPSTPLALRALGDACRAVPTAGPGAPSRPPCSWRSPRGAEGQARRGWV